MKRWVVLNPTPPQCMVTLLSLGTTASCMISEKTRLDFLIDRFLKKGLTTSLGRNISVWIYCQIIVNMASERIVIAGLFVFIFCQAFSSTSGRFVQILTWFRMVFNVKWEKIGLSLPALCEKSHCNFTQKRVCFIRITWWNTHWRKHCRGLQFSRKSWCRSQGRILVSRNIWTFSV